MKKRFLILMSILCLVVLAVALIFVAAAPVSAVNQITTGVTGIQAMLPGPVTSATTDSPYSHYYIMFAGFILLTSLALVALRHNIFWSGRWLLATVCTKWRNRGSLAAGSQLLFPI